MKMWIVGSILLKSLSCQRHDENHGKMPRAAERACDQLHDNVIFL